MAAWWLWVRSDARRRWRPALALLVLVALAGGVVMAAIAGGRRNGTTVERAVALTAPADVWALPNEPGFDWDAVRAFPEVLSVAEFPITYFEVEGFGLDFNPSFPPASPEGMTEVEVPIVVEGRVPAPHRVDEVSISPAMAQRGLQVGDRLAIDLFAPEVGEALLTGSEPPDIEGPRQPVTVVGITKGSTFASDVQTTLAFYRRYQANLTPPSGYINAWIRLREGSHDVVAFDAHLAELAGLPVETRDGTADSERLARATHLERDALYGFGIAAAAAALVLVGQAVARMVALSVPEAEQLRTLGFTRAASATAFLPAAATAVGTLGGAVLAYVVSGRFPVGVGRRIEPDPGRDLDWAVLVPGGVVLVVVGTVASLAIAKAALRPRGLRRAAPGPRIATRLTATDVPVTAALGVRWALDPGQGRATVPVRSALVGAVAGVLGVVAAMTFGAGLDRAAADASLFGQSFDAAILALGDERAAEQVEALLDDPEVAMVAELRNVVVAISGQPVSVFGVRALRGEFDQRMVRGQPPAQDDEIALAPSTMDALDVAVGDEVRVDGSGAVLTLTGIGFSPLVGHTSYDEGAQMTDEGLRRIAPLDEDLKFRAFIFGFEPGGDAADAIENLDPAVFPPGEVGTDVSFDTQENLAGVAWVPPALAAFLAALAIGAVGHALASTVRRRRRELSVLRTLGMTPGQARATVAWQATTLAVVGAAVGVPTGVAVGRTIWQLVAEQTPMVYVAPAAVAGTLAAAAGALAVFNVVAAWPASQAARLRPAEAIRAE